MALLQSDHVIFADEITADDEKFSPQHDDFPENMIEGILSRFGTLIILKVFNPVASLCEFSFDICG